MTPAQLARLQAARRMPNSATVAIVLDEYHALIPTLRAADSVPALQGEILHLKSALAAQVEATEREAQAAAAAKARADEVRRNMQAAKATAESRALRAEAALERGHGELLARIAEMEAESARREKAAHNKAQDDAAHLAVARERLAGAKSRNAELAIEVSRLKSRVKLLEHTPKPCSSEGCKRTVYAHGLCQRHYQARAKTIHQTQCTRCGSPRRTPELGICRPCYLADVQAEKVKRLEVAHV